MCAGRPGADVTTAVITVPAAFGALQCEATARAAELAGLQEAPLLQEPIAAAIGYGARPGSANQRWLVFDLGGGTLDIAVVSTREGRLNVLEHRGNNLLGGKDIDRSIVEQIFFPALEASYDLRASGPKAARSALLPRLRIKAEEAKIDLSTEPRSSFRCLIWVKTTPESLSRWKYRSRVHSLRGSWNRY